MKKRKITFPVVVEKDKNGFFAYCPSLQGCYTQGDSYEKTMMNMKDAIRLNIIDRKLSKTFSAPEFFSLSSLEVTT